MVQEDKSKIHFQDGGCGGHFEFPINMILAIFISAEQPLAPSFDLICRVVCEEI